MKIKYNKEKRKAVFIDDNDEIMSIESGKVENLTSHLLELFFLGRVSPRRAQELIHELAALELKTMNAFTESPESYLKYFALQFLNMIDKDQCIKDEMIVVEYVNAHLGGVIRIRIKELDYYWDIETYNDLKEMIDVLLDAKRISATTAERVLLESDDFFHLSIGTVNFRYKIDRDNIEINNSTLNNEYQSLAFLEDVNLVLIELFFDDFFNKKEIFEALSLVERLNLARRSYSKCTQKIKDFFPESTSNDLFDALGRLHSSFVHIHLKLYPNNFFESLELSVEIFDFTFSTKNRDIAREFIAKLHANSKINGNAIETCYFKVSKACVPSDN